MGSKSLHDIDSLVSEINNLTNQLVVVIQCHNLISATDANSINQNVGNRPPARIFFQLVLQLGTLRMLIKLDDIGIRRDRVFLKQNTLGAL